MRDEFLSEEDLDLKNLSEAELYAWWDEWFWLAQATNELDEHVYSHGVFRESPGLGPSAIELARPTVEARGSSGEKQD